MRRTRLRAALLVVVAVSLAVIGYEVSRSISLRKLRTAAELGVKVLPEVAQHIRDFRRLKVENGRTVWEISAADAQYFEADGRVVVQAPRVTLYFADGKRQAHITGTEGQLQLDGREVTEVTLRGDVRVRLDDMEVTTAEATYVRARDLISAPGEVTLHGSELDVRGHGMELEVEPQRLRLLAEVHTVFRGRDAAS